MWSLIMLSFRWLTKFQNIFNKVHFVRILVNEISFSRSQSDNIRGLPVYLNWAQIIKTTAEAKGNNPNLIIKTHFWVCFGLVQASFCFTLNLDGCIVLYCIVLYCIVLYCIVLYCIVLYCIVLYCIVIVYWPSRL